MNKPCLERSRNQRSYDWD